MFGSKFFIPNTKDKLSKFDPKSDLGVFLGYSSVSKMYKVCNKRTQNCKRNHTYLFQREEKGFGPEYKQSGKRPGEFVSE